MIWNPSKKTTAVLCGGCASMTASLPLLLKHFHPGVSDTVQGLVTGLPLGLSIGAAALYLKRSKESQA